MGRAKLRLPVLQRFYRRYLDDASPADFIRSVSQRYALCTLERLAESSDRETRRAATLALGLIGDFRVNGALGRRLVDADRGVRLLAETGIREVWFRDGGESQQLWLRTIARLNKSGHHSQAAREAGRLIEEAPWFAEARHQRALAEASSGRYQESIRECRKSLRLNPYHFEAAAAMGVCYLRLDDEDAALACFRRALVINPALEAVRMQVACLQRKRGKRRK